MIQGSGVLCWGWGRMCLHTRNYSVMASSRLYDQVPCWASKGRERTAVLVIQSWALWLLQGQALQPAQPWAATPGACPGPEQWDCLHFSFIGTLSLAQRGACSVAAHGNHSTAVTALSLCCPSCLQIWILWSLITSVNDLLTLVSIHHTEQCVCQQEYLLGQSMI